MDAQKLTTKSQDALSGAIRQAANLGNPSVEPVHLLVALLGDTEGTAGALLDAVGVDRTAVVKAADEAAAKLPAASGSTVQAPGLSRPLYQVLQVAQDQATELG